MKGFSKKQDANSALIILYRSLRERSVDWGESNITREVWYDITMHEQPEKFSSYMKGRHSAQEADLSRAGQVT